MPIDSLKARMFRIKQASGLDLSTAGSTSPRRSFHSPALCVFHEISRAAGPSQQATKDDGLRHGLVLTFCRGARTRRARCRRTDSARPDRVPSAPCAAAAAKTRRDRYVLLASLCAEGSAEALHGCPQTRLPQCLTCFYIYGTEDAVHIAHERHTAGG